MGLSCRLLGTVFLALLIINSSEASDLEVLGDLKTGKNVKGSDISNKNDGGKEKVVNPEKKGQDQVGTGLKEGADNKTTDDVKGKQVGSKGGGIEQKKTDASGSEPKKTDGSGSEQKKTDGTSSEQKKTDVAGSEQKKTVDTSSKQEKPNDNVTKDVDKKDKARGDSGSQSKDISATQGRKEGGEACDSSSNSCTIEEKSVIACLRVPGSESEKLSLLIQNKGNVPVSVTLFAPDFVKLEKKQVQVQANNNEKVKVSIGNGESTTGIILNAGNGNCNIDIKEMSVQRSKEETAVSAQLTYINLLKSTPSAWFISFAAILVIASVCIGIGFRRKYGARNSPSYEKLEMELPVSGASKVIPDSNDGWDDSWGDSWDDEEAPKTPSVPVTPSISSNGIASRRINKEAWKD
ncbi:uncharacterized protein [Coffea arabica]|uniref:DUF7356 domain-containing protein n=1 Tax=Coffea arabica TaxID=13443 RepID=A0ABM4VI85_COFAR